MKVLARVFVVLLVIALIAGASLGVYLYQVNESLPQISSLEEYRPPVVSSIYSRDGELLLEVGKEKRIVAPFEEIPLKVINCFLAAEDDSFYEHSGVDYMGILRSVVKNILAGRIVGGGSTITQQVAKTFFTTSARTYTRKIKDTLLAKKIEENFTKSEILFLYLNQMYFGGGYYGIKMAAKGYYRKELSDLTIAEAALLAGLLARPHGYSPYVGPKYAKMRQRYVLRRLFNTGKISELEYEQSLDEELKIYPREDSLRKAGYFVDWIKSQIFQKIEEEDFLTGGYEVITSLDWGYQKKAKKSVLKGLKEIDKRQGYRGPIAYLGSEKERLSFFENVFRGILEKQRRYQILKPSGEMASSLAFKNNREKLEFLIRELKEGDSYRGIVQNVDDQLKKVTVEFFPGIRAVISQKGFSWAKPRLLSPKQAFRPSIKIPSEILREGDIVLVNLVKKIESFSEAVLFEGTLDQSPRVQGALLSLESETGEILSMVGGRDYEESQFNRAIQSKRQPGSSFKSFYYAAALEKGYTPATIIMDTPYALSGMTDELSWKPQNYDRKYLGPITFRMALERSRNIPSIKIAQDVSPSGFRSFLQRLSLELEFPNDLSFSLGAFPVRLLDLVEGYAIFSNLGKRVPLRPILLVRKAGEQSVDTDFLGMGRVEESEDDFDDAFFTLEPDSEILIGDFEFLDISDSSRPMIAHLYKKNLKGSQVFDERLAYIMTNILKGVIRSGTGRRANHVGSFIAGKTGTTNDYIDAWFLGYNREVVTGVWTGFDTNQTMGYGEGGAVSALPIWSDYMKFVLEDRGDRDFRIPDGIVNVKINKRTGKMARLGDRSYFLESFVLGTEPNLSGESGGNDEELPHSIDEDFFLNQ